MNDVRQSDIDIVVNAFEIFFQLAIKQQGFNTTDFLDVMELTFKASGYRDTLDKNGQRNILIILDSGVGDFILSSGAVREIRRLYPDAYIEMVIYPRCQNMAEHCPYVDKVVSKERNYPNWNSPEFFYMHDVEFAKNLLKRRFDVCYSFGFYIDSTFLMYMSGAKTRITFDLINTPSEIFNCLATHPVKIASQHCAEKMMAIIDDVLHSPVSNREIEVWYTEDDLQVAKSVLDVLSRPIYALCMGGTRIGNHYPPEKYAKVVEMILDEEPTATFIILGGGKEDLKSAEIFKSALSEKFKKNIVDCTNKLTYRKSAAALSMCGMYIGNDTGTTHIAAAVKCPVLNPNCFPANFTLTYNDTPKLYCPYRIPSVLVMPKKALPGCDHPEFGNNHGCIAKMPHCITQIEPETIFRGFHLLKERIAQNLIEPLYIS